jgi:hypothetical protein
VRVAWPGRAALVRLACIVVLAAGGFQVLLLPLYPPLDFDANAYHLAVARTFARAQEVFVTPYLRFPVGPLNAHMLFTLLLLFVGDPVVAGLVSLLAAVLIAVTVYSWAADGAGGAAGWLAVACWVSSGLVLDRAHTASYHMVCALMTTLAVRCCVHFASSTALPWLVLTGVFSGLAVGTYYAGLFFALALGLAVAWRGWTAARPRWPAVFALACTLAAAPWLVRNAVVTANPVWPLFGSVLGVGPFWDQADLEHVSANLAQIGKPRTLVNFLRAPYDVTFHAAAFQPTGTLSVAPLLAFALAAVAAWRDRHSAAIVALVVAYGAFWFVSAQALRYLLPVLPLLAVAGARSWALVASGPVLGRAPKLRAVIEVALLGSLCLPALAYLREVDRARGRLPLDAAARDAWREARMPGYSALRVANRRPAPLYSYDGLWLAASSEGSFMGDVIGPGRYRDVARTFDSGAALAATLRRLGARRFLLNRSGGAEAPAADEAFASRFALLYTGGGAELFELRESPHDYPWPPPERLRNGDFEGPAAGSGPAGWTASPARRPNDAPLVHAGSGSARVGRAESLSQAVPVSAGEACTFGAWARTRRSPRRLVLEVDWPGPARLRAERSEVAVGDRWTRVAVRSLVPQGAVEAVVRLETTGGRVFVDEASFRCLDQPETRGGGEGLQP